MPRPSTDSTKSPRGVREAVREQRLPFFRDDRPLWRISLPPATRALAVPGDWLIDWGGAQRWLKTDAGAEEVRRSAAEQRGYAVQFRGGDRQGEVFPPLPGGLGALHGRLKGVFDPRRIKDYGSRASRPHRHRQHRLICLSVAGSLPLGVHRGDEPPEPS
ncbi:MAG: hypothetical protein ACREYC_23345 [Gammaproteobacteria bacterium]